MMANHAWSTSLRRKKARKPKTAQQVEKDVYEMKALTKTGEDALAMLDTIDVSSDPAVAITSCCKELTKAHEKINKAYTKSVSEIRDGLVQNENDVGGVYVDAQSASGTLGDEVANALAMMNTQIAVAKTPRMTFTRS